MKFSGNLFKIQTKISVSAFILMSAVSGAVLAMDDESESGSYVQRGSVFTPPKGSVKGEKDFSPDSGDFVKAISKQRVRPNNNTKPPADFRPRGGGNPEQKGSGLYSAIEVQVKASPKKFGMAIAEKSKIAGTILENYKKKRASRPNSEVQTDELTELPPFSEVLAAWRDVSQGGLQYVRQELLSGVLYPSPRKTKNMTRDLVEEVVEEVISPGVKRREEEESSEIARQRAVASQKLDFYEGDALVARGGSDVFSMDSLFTVSNQDQITLQIQKGSEVVDVVTTMADLLKPVETSDANDKLGVVRLYFQYLSSDEKGREKKIKKIQEKYPNISGSEALFAHLQSEAVAAFSSVPDYLLYLVRQSKQDKAALTRFVGGARDVYSYVASLEKANARLEFQADSLRESMQSSFQAFNSAFSVFGLTLRQASDVDGAVVSQVQTTYRKLHEDHQRLEILYRENCENNLKLLTANTSYLKKMDEDRALIEALYDEKRELQRQLESAQSRERALALREEELLRTIEKLRDEKRQQSNKVKSSVPSHIVKPKGNF